jgi:serine/threonine-protein kinase RsbT
VTAEVTITIEHESDVVEARQRGRELAAAEGFSGTDQTLIATAISEVARNMIEHARGGVVVLSALGDGERRGVQVVARDEGPGIVDVNLALRDGFSTRKSLGLGLPGARRLMDELEIDSRPGAGTVVTLRKWGPGPRR